MGTALSIVARVVMHIISSREFSDLASNVVRQATKEIIRHIQRGNQTRPSQRRYPGGMTSQS